MSSAHQYLVTATIDGVPTGAWDTMDGGGTTADVTKRRPGGAPREKANRARPTHDDATLTRENELERDWEQLNRLRPRVGRATVVITKQPLDDDDMPQGKPTTLIGILSSLNPGSYDSGSDEPTMAELVAVITEVS